MHHESPIFTCFAIKFVIQFTRKEKEGRKVRHRHSSHPISQTYTYKWSYFTINMQCKHTQCLSIISISKLILVHVRHLQSIPSTHSCYSNNHKYFVSCIHIHFMIYCPLRLILLFMFLNNYVQTYSNTYQNIFTKTTSNIN